MFCLRLESCYKYDINSNQIPADNPKNVICQVSYFYIVIIPLFRKKKLYGIFLLQMLLKTIAYIMKYGFVEHMLETYPYNAHRKHTYNLLHI